MTGFSKPALNPKKFHQIQNKTDNTRFKKYLKRFAIGLLFSIGIVCLLIQLQVVQSFVAQKTVSWLEQKTGAEIHLGHFRLKGLRHLLLEDVYVEDVQNDTLANIGRLKIDFQFWPLFSQEIKLNQIELEGSSVLISIDKNGQFNFDHFVQAFTDPSAQPDTIASSPWEINLSDIHLSDVQFTYQDEQSPFYLLARVGDLNTSLSEFSLLKKKIDVDELALGNSSVDIQYEENPTDITTTPVADTISFPDVGWTITTNSLGLNNNQLSYRPFGNSQTPQVFDPAYIDIDLDQLLARDLSMNAKVLSGNIQQVKGKILPEIELEELRTRVMINQQQISLADFFLKTPFSQIEHQTLLSYNEFTDLGDFFNRVTFDSELENLIIHPKDIRRFVGDQFPKSVNQPYVLTGKWQGTLADLDIESLRLDQSQAIQLQLNGQLKGLPDVNQLKFDLHINQLKTAYADLQPLLPENTLPKGLAPWQTFQLKTHIRGITDSIIAGPIDLITESGPELHGHITATRLPDIKQANFNLQIDSFSTEINDWVGFVSDTFPSMLYRLGEIQANGTYEGSIYTFATDLDFYTDLGLLSSNISADFNQDYSDASYQGNIKLDEFDLGAFLQDSLLGQFTLTADVKGEGLEPMAINSSIDGLIDQFTYKEYAYDSLVLDGHLKEGVFFGKADIRDEHLSFSFMGKAPVIDTVGGADFRLVLDTVNLHRLNLYNSPLGMKADIIAKSDQLELDNWRGFLKIRDFKVTDSLQAYQTDSIVLLSKELENKRHILDLNADFLKTKVVGNYKLTSLPKELSEWLDQYFPISKWLYPQDTSIQRSIADGSVSPAHATEVAIELSLSDPSKLSNWLLPELHQLDTFNLSIAFEPGAQKWELDARTPFVKYADFTLDSMHLVSNSVDQGISTNLAFQQFLIGDNTHIPQPKISVQLQDQQLITSFSSKSLESDSTIWQIGTLLNPKGDELHLTMETAPIFNGVNWSIDKDNLITYKDNGDYSIQALNFHENDQALLINGQREQAGEKAFINLQFNQFLLQTISPLFDFSEDYMTGVINGTAKVNQAHSNINYLAEISLNDWTIDSNLIGDISLAAKQLTENDAIQLNATLTGKENKVDFHGEYDASQRQFDLTGVFDSLSLRTLDPFLAGFIEGSEGGLSGQFSLKGTPEKPVLKGFLNVEGLSTKIGYTETRYKVNSGQLTFDEKSIEFGEWTLADAANNPASLRGNITHNNFEDLELDLNFKAENFEFLNTTAESNDLFYGKLLLDANVDIKGKSDKPKFHVKATTAPLTKFFVVPLTDEQSIAAEDYIVFGTPKLDSLGRDTNQVKEYRLRSSRGVDLTLDLGLTDKAELQVIVDPLTGDKLTCRGNANLSVIMNEAGDLDIYGNYEVEEGKYNFSYEQLAKREFLLLKDSRITFAGDPLSANLDIRAAYETRVPLSDLVGNLLTDDYGSNTASSKRVEVRVLLKIKGDLIKPELTFDIELIGNPQGSMVDAARYRLEQLRENPNELNTQVFGLLLFNRFIESSGEQSLSSTGEAVVWSSVGNLVSGMLNNLADQYLKGITVNIGIDTYQGGNADNSSLRTELEVGLSKQLFNDRLNVKVGGNFNVGEEGENENNAETNFAGDFTLEYALTPSGNYQLRVYRRSDYDALNQSNVIRSGVGFTLQKSFKGKRQKNAGQKKK